MARQRRGGGFRPPELRGTLGTLLRTTLAQAGTLRDVLERGAREGRSRIDSALEGARSSRRRTDALAELGEIVLDLIRRGEIDLDELPEARDLVAHLDDIDAGHDTEHDEPPAVPPARNRFDSRKRDASRARDSDDDGTVSSKTWARPRSPKPAPAPRVWRPPADTPPDGDTVLERPPTPSSNRRSGEPTQPGRTRKPASIDEEKSTAPTRPKDPARKGGIHFDDDDDLADYMHPDDVPPKGTPDGDA
jgi:hypothetical protein